MVVICFQKDHMLGEEGAVQCKIYKGGADYPIFLILKVLFLFFLLVFLRICKHV